MPVLDMQKFKERLKAKAKPAEQPAAPVFSPEQQAVNLKNIRDEQNTKAIADLNKPQREPVTNAKQRIRAKLDKKNGTIIFPKRDEYAMRNPKKPS